LRCSCLARRSPSSTITVCDVGSRGARRAFTGGGRRPDSRGITQPMTARAAGEHRLDVAAARAGEHHERLHCRASRFSRTNSSDRGRWRFALRIEAEKLLRHLEAAPGRRDCRSWLSFVGVVRVCPGCRARRCPRELSFRMFLELSSGRIFWRAAAGVRRLLCGCRLGAADAEAQQVAMDRAAAVLTGARRRSQDPPRHCRFVRHLRGRQRTGSHRAAPPARR